MAVGQDLDDLRRKRHVSTVENCLPFVSSFLPRSFVEFELEAVVVATWAVDRAMSPVDVVAVVVAAASDDRAKSPAVVGCWPTDALEVEDGGEVEMNETGICHY